MPGQLPSAPADLTPPHPTSSSSHHFCNHLREAWARTAQQNQSQVSDPQKPWDNKMIYFISCLFMLFLSHLLFLAFCCAAIATETAVPLVKKGYKCPFHWPTHVARNLPSVDSGQRVSFGKSQSLEDSLLLRLWAMKQFKYGLLVIYFFSITLPSRK